MHNVRIYIMLNAESCGHNSYSHELLRIIVSYMYEFVFYVCDVLSNRLVKEFSNIQMSIESFFLSSPHC